jgi:hypothetical protein
VAGARYDSLKGKTVPVTGGASGIGEAGSTDLQDGPMLEGDEDRQPGWKGG